MSNNNGVFTQYAPLYYAQNLPVIPLHDPDAISPSGTKLGKAPAIPAWQRFHNTLPSSEEQKYFISRFTNANMGMVLGEQSRCVALDIDTDSEEEINFITSVVPKSPFIRIGKKGMVMMFRYNGEQTFRIKDISGRTICELLSSKTQVVLPPSIHPDTKAPYTATSNLYEVVDRLPVLPKDLESILRTGFKETLKIELSSSGSTRTIDFVSAGSRDVKMTAVAGVYACSVLRGEITLKEAIEMMRAWCFERVEHVAGDDVDPEKAIRNLVKFLINDVNGPKKRVLPTGWDHGMSQNELEQLGLVFGEESFSWDFNKLNDYLCEKIPETAANPIARNDVINTAVERIARSKTLSSLEEDRCIKHISMVMPDITVASLRKRIAELRCNGLAGTNHSEIARAVLKEIDSKIPNYEKVDDNDEYPSVRYYNDKFYTWGGSHWEELKEFDIEKVIATEFGDLPQAKKASDHKGIIHIMKTLVLSNLGLQINGVNFANGFVDQYGILNPHSRKYGCTYTLPYCYNKEIGHKPLEVIAPKFAKFLESIWGNEIDYAERVHSLRQVMAATMFGLGASFNKAILLYGVGGSGKSQLLTIIRKLLPDDIVSVVSPYDFSDKFKVTMLSKSVLNLCGELKENNNIPADIFKQITDGAMLQGQYKGGQIFYFTPKCTHWFASNYLPKSTDGSEGFNRRWLILSFNRIVPAEERIRGLGDIIIEEEREGIASWVIEEMPELRNKSDYDLPPSHYDLLDKMHGGNDSVYYFFTNGANEKACPRYSPGSSTPIKTLYDSYRNFSYTQGTAARVVGYRRFVEKLNELVVIFNLSMTPSHLESVTLEENLGVGIRRGVKLSA